MIPFLFQRYVQLRKKEYMHAFAVRKKKSVILKTSSSVCKVLIKDLCIYKKRKGLKTREHIELLALTCCESLKEFSFLFVHS